MDIKDKAMSSDYQITDALLKVEDLQNGGSSLKDELKQRTKQKLCDALQAKAPDPDLVFKLIDEGTQNLSRPWCINALKIMWFINMYLWT